jgi:DNA replication protein DnaC
MKTTPNDVLPGITATLAAMQAKCKSDAEIQASRDEYDEHVRQDKITMLRAEWNAPLRHSQFTPEVIGPWGEAFTKLAKRLGTGFLVAMIGTRGNGKTQMAVELMKTTTDSLRTALFTTATGFFMAVKATYRKDSEQTEAGVLRGYCKPSLLVVDEAARRAETGWENNLLFELLNQRYNAMRDTILICNMSRTEFEASLGASLVSRMNETGGIVECNWPSFR